MLDLAQFNGGKFDAGGFVVGLFERMHRMAADADAGDAAITFTWNDDTKPGDFYPEVTVRVVKQQEAPRG